MATIRATLVYCTGFFFFGGKAYDVSLVLMCFYVFFVDLNFISFIVGCVYLVF